MKFKAVIPLFCLLVFVVVQGSYPRWNELEEYSFEQYVSDFGKVYSEKEYELRKTIFEERLADIRKHNSDPTKTWKRGLNSMSDFTTKEFRRLLGFKKQLAYNSPRKPATVPFALKNPSALPSYIDWREQHIITAVKDQGRCGSCWTFGTTETIESHVALKTGKLEVLSEQQILDCTPNPDACGGTGGCEGGTVELAYKQIIKMGGITSEWLYPYISYQGKDFSCLLNSSHPMYHVQLSGYNVLPTNEYAPVLNALVHIGPLAINVDASAWSDYETGVFNGCNATHPDIDHVVALVGYGTDPKLGDYWLIRNSWSPYWGEDGYIRLPRTSEVQCGVDINPQDGTGCNGGPSTVTVCGACGILFDVSYPLIIH